MANESLANRKAIWIGGGLRCAVRIVTGNSKILNSGPAVLIQHSHAKLNQKRTREWALLRDLEIARFRKPRIRSRRPRACVQCLPVCTMGNPPAIAPAGTKKFWKCADYGVLLRPIPLRNKAGTLLVTPRIQRHVGELWASVRQSPHACSLYGQARNFFLVYATLPLRSQGVVESRCVTRCSGS